MSKIVLTRIDNRLVHGQVGVTWMNNINAEAIVVVDDQVAINPMSQKLMESVAKTSGAKIYFYNVDEFIDVMKNSTTKRKLFLVIHDPIVGAQIVKKGVMLDNINVGNMHYEKGKGAFNRKVYLSKEEAEELNYLCHNCDNVYYQDIPGTIAEKIEEIDFEKLK